MKTSFTYDADGDLLQTKRTAGRVALSTVSSTYTLTGNLADRLDARSDRTGDGSHLACPAIDLGSVQAERLDPDADFFGGRRGRCDIPKPKHFGTACLFDDIGFQDLVPFVSDAQPRGG